MPSVYQPKCEQCKVVLELKGRTMTMNSPDPIGTARFLYECPKCKKVITVEW